METKKLEFKDVAGYMPYGLMSWNRRPGGHEDNFVEMNVVGYSKGSNKFHLQINIYNGSFVNVDEIKPILRPLSDMYKTITHNGKEIVPIVELANISSTDHEWRLNKSLNGWCYATDEESEIRFEYDYELETFLLTDGDIHYPVYSLPELFDYLHELKIDYRGLIDAGLAVDANTLSVNPYK